jgi:quercetin dioxygenase-like cupin family protein
VPHFPKLLRTLPPFEGPFDAFKLEAKNCEVLFASYPEGTAIKAHSHDTVDGKETRYGPGDWYHLPAHVMHSARFEVETSEIEFWFRAARR